MSDIKDNIKKALGDGAYIKVIKDDKGIIDFLKGANADADDTFIAKYDKEAGALVAGVGKGDGEVKGAETGKFSTCKPVLFAMLGKNESRAPKSPTILEMLAGRVYERGSGVKARQFTRRLTGDSDGKSAAAPYAAILTAENPFAMSMRSSWNKRVNNKLRKELSAIKDAAAVIPQHGKYGNVENSFVVLSHPSADKRVFTRDISALADKYGQESWLLVDFEYETMEAWSNGVCAVTEKIRLGDFSAGDSEEDKKANKDYLSFFSYDGDGRHITDTSRAAAFLDRLEEIEDFGKLRYRLDFSDYEWSRWKLKDITGWLSAHFSEFAVGDFTGAWTGFESDIATSDTALLYAKRRIRAVQEQDGDANELAVKYAKELGTTSRALMGSLNESVSGALAEMFDNYGSRLISAGDELAKIVRSRTKTVEERDGDIIAVAGRGRVVMLNTATTGFFIYYIKKNEDTLIADYNRSDNRDRVVFDETKD